MAARDVWHMTMTFENGTVVERDVAALYLIGDAIMETRDLMIDCGDITSIVLT